MIITTLFQKPVTTYAASVSYLILLSRGARSTVRQLRWPRQSTGSHNNSPVAAVYTARSTDGERERESNPNITEHTHTFTPLEYCQATTATCPFYSLSAFIGVSYTAGTDKHRRRTS